AADKACRMTALPSHKMQEIAVLGGGPGRHLSMVNAEIIGHRLERPGEGFFENKIVDLVIFESVRLMGEFPNLNAAFRPPGHVEHHQQIIPGVAFNGGGRLVLHALPTSCLTSAADIRAEILSGFRKYAQGVLKQDEGVKPTYTVTDLSGAGADFI